MRFFDWLLRRDVKRAGPQPADTGDYAFAQFQALYGMPNAETVTPAFEQFAATAFGGNAVIFGVELRRLQVFTEATFKWRAVQDKKLFGDKSLAKLEHPWPNGDTGDLLARMELDAAFAGNAYIRDCGDRLERLRPDWVTIVSRIRLDERGEQVREVIGYWYNPLGDMDRDEAFYPVDEVAHWAPIPDPLANFRGMSWLSPIIREVNADTRMSQFRDAFFANAATANMIVRYQHKILPEKIRELKAQIDARHTGPDNAFGTIVFDEGADTTVVGSNMEGAAFNAIQAAGETRICMAAGVPAVIAGARQGLASSAPGEYVAAMRAFADLTIRPNWRGACRALEKLVLPDVTFNGVATLWYDTSDVSALAQGEADKASTLQQMAGTANTLIMAGYTPDSVTAALTSGDFSLLKHSGLVSVQMQQLSAPVSSGVPPVNGNRPALRAAGHDVTPGHDELHYYWTREPEGRAKWVESPEPWTTLVAHLSAIPAVGPVKAKVYASRWFIEVFGFAAGSDKNRVLHGRPPRGHRVGPG